MHTIDKTAAKNAQSPPPKMKPWRMALLWRWNNNCAASNAEAAEKQRKQKVTDRKQPGKKTDRQESGKQRIGKQKGGGKNQKEKKTLNTK